ncbi:MAG: hypothetical protein NVV83_22735 [Afipia sp.]|nr:hypothetical protein [Afipia sp.]
MRTLDLRPLQVIPVALLLILICAAPLARGSQVIHDDPWNSEHIDRLPAQKFGMLSAAYADSHRERRITSPPISRIRS